ncbi:hypothetical protein BDP27DRAFT_42557 [Rhodocollybia butyracea]|uniref:Uncharacterized protein n=1 Tax=Rhodocollybia butyracea TaxID=206335 RepID=A0A9P5PZ70_9AGAR|nr:hypothetical protein BDP27DRAFT_42557 [Rhodocollybia butyracea]
MRDERMKLSKRWYREMQMSLKERSIETQGRNEINCILFYCSVTYLYLSYLALVWSDFYFILISFSSEPSSFPSLVRSPSSYLLSIIIFCSFSFRTFVRDIDVSISYIHKLLLPLRI